MRTCNWCCVSMLSLLLLLLLLLLFWADVVSSSQRQVSLVWAWHGREAEPSGCGMSSKGAGTTTEV